MIVRDEERFLPTCLTHAQKLTDDICIVDTGSVDNSVQIATSFGARVVRQPWAHDFSSARNESLKLSRRPWVAILDADEFISEEACQEVQKHLSDPNIGGLVFPIIDEQKHGTPRKTSLVRAWRQAPNIYFRHRIHEDILWSLLPDLERKGMRLAAIQGEVVHFGYQSDVMLQKSKQQRDTGILLRCVQDNPADLYSWFKLLEQAAHGNDRLSMTRYAARARYLMSRIQNQEMQHYLGDLVRLLHREAQLRSIEPLQRLAWLKYWASVAPMDSTIATLEGTLHEEMGDFGAAKQSFERALKGSELHPNHQMRRVRPLLGLCRLKVAQNQLEEALQIAQTAALASPGDLEAQTAVREMTKMVAQCSL